MSKIEWTEKTWNPTTGCTKVSQGCKYCYAETMALRLHAMGQEKYRNAFDLAIHDDALGLPTTWRKGALVFVNSMSDLFHEDIPFDFLQQVFTVMRECPQHRFQILTKRADYLAELAPRLHWPPNVWMGVTVEHALTVDRIDALRQVNPAVRFLSLEPLLGPLYDLNLKNIHWVIVGGESGPRARPMAEAWALDLRDQCKTAGVPFFFKQWGGGNKKGAGRLLQGRTYDEMPEPLEMALF